MPGDDVEATGSQLIRDGYCVFPVAVGFDAGSGKTTKRPLTVHGHKDATADMAQWHRLLASSRLASGEVLAVGLHPGGSGLVVFDCDVTHGDGTAVADADGVPSLVRVATPSGGEHRYTRKPDPARRVGNRVPAHWAGLIDVRSDDGWVVAPGSRTPWGDWRGELPAAALVPVTPEWLLPALSGPAPSGSGTQWRSIDETKVHPLTLATLELAMEKLGAHSPTANTGCGEHGDWTCLKVCRPGKGHGVSATIGHVGPDVLWSWSSSWPGAPPGTAVTLDQLRDAEDPFEAAVADELARLRIRDEAARRRQLESIRPAAVPLLKTLADWDADPPDEPVMAVESLLPEHANLIVTADAKAGKTTLVANLARSLVDQVPFLGAYQVSDHPGRVVLVDLEMGAAQWYGWLRELAIQNRDMVVPVAARGDSSWLSSLLDDQAPLVDWLVTARAATLVLDPFSVLLNVLGIDENDNTGVGRVLVALDQLKARAEMRHIVLPHHTSKADSRRARGASRIEGWPDAMWRILRSGEMRTFHADGRDVHMADGRDLTMSSQRELVVGDGVPLGRRTAAVDWQQRVVDALDALHREQPSATGFTTREIRGRTHGFKGQAADDWRAALDSLVSSQVVTAWRDGRSSMYRIGQLTDPKYEER